MQSKLKIVVYSGKCSTCEYKDLAEDEDPCHECLSTPVAEDSHQPINYKEA